LITRLNELPQRRNMFKEIVFTGVDSVRHFRPKRKAAVISILDYSERGYRPDLTEFAAVLLLEFEDVSDGAPILFGKELRDDAPIGQDRCPHNFEERFCTTRDAKLIHEFVERVSKDPRVNTLYIHCFAGQSRSAAVAQYFLEKYAGQVQDAGFGNRTTGAMNRRLYRLLGSTDPLRAGKEEG